jgi:hypothetical protein
MKKLTLSILLGLGLISQIHDLKAEDSKPLDYTYLVLNETLIEDLPAFKSLHSEWQSWLKNSNIKLKEYSVWTDSQGNGYATKVFKSLAEVEENQNNFRTAWSKYRSEHNAIHKLWIKMSASGKSSVWKIVDELSTQPLKEDTTQRYEFRINRLVQVKKDGIEDFIIANKEVNAIDKEVGINYDSRIYKNVFGYESPSYLVTTGSSDVYSYYSEWKKRKDKRQSSPKFADFSDKLNNSIRRTETRHLTFQKELHYKP